MNDKFAPCLLQSLSLEILCDDVWWVKSSVLWRGRGLEQHLRRMFGVS